MIDNNRNDPTMMWKTLKKVIRGEEDVKEIKVIDFEILENSGESSLADIFNLLHAEY